MLVLGQKKDRVLIGLQVFYLVFRVSFVQWSEVSKREGLADADPVLDH